MNKSRNAARRKQQLLTQRGIQCEACGFSCECALEVHHIVRVSAGGTDDGENLVLLCANCHAVADYLHSAPVWLRSDFPYPDDVYDKLLRYANPQYDPTVFIRTSDRLRAMVQRLELAKATA